MKSFVLENGFFLLNDGSGALLKGAVRIQEGKILAVAKTLPSLKGEKRISLAGQLVIPGFIQTHVHLCQTLFRNLADDLELLDWLKLKIWPMEAAHTPKSLRASARLGIAELLAGGTTTLLDMGTVKHTDEIFEAAKEMGIRAFIGKCLMDRKENPKGLREDTNSALKENIRLAEHWHGKEEGRLRYAHAPRFLLSCSETLLREVALFSKTKNHLVHTHASENQSEVKAVRRMFGQENIEALEALGLTSERLVLAHCIWLSEKEKKLLAKSKTKVSHCPSSNLKLASGICQVPELQKLGISVSLGADGAPCNNNLDMFREMRLASLLQKPKHGPKVLPAREAFEMATLEGAKALGIQDQVGQIRPGFQADLVALQLGDLPMALELSEKRPEIAYSALVYGASASQVTQTWVQGRSVYRKGQFSGFDSDKLVREAKAERKKLLARI